MTRLPSRETMLAGMLSANPDCNGLFITGVTSTGIYCLPSCRARKPRPHNVVFYARPAEARAAGLRPCQRCKPDDFYAGVDAQENQFLTACQRVNFSRNGGISELAQQFRVSPSKLNDLFRLYLHCTPAEWLASQRVQAARTALLHTDKQVAEIAFEVGFQSLSSFNQQFRQRCGLTPLACRNLTLGKPFKLTFPRGFHVPVLLGDLERDPHSTTTRVIGAHVQTSLRLPGGAARLHLTFDRGQVSVQRAQAGPLAPQDALALHDQLLRLLGWRGEPERFERMLRATPHLKSLVTGRAGTHLPLTPEPFDGLLWAILGQQVTFQTACTFRQRLTVRFGEGIGDGLFITPTPQVMAATSLNDLRSCGLTGARAELLQDVAQRVAGGELDLLRLAAGSAQQAEKSLRGIRGIGPWTASYVLLRGLGFQDVVPLGDSALATALQRFYQLPVRPTATKTAELMQPFAPYRSLATFHFWQLFKENP